MTLHYELLISHDNAVVMWPISGELLFPGRDLASILMADVVFEKLKNGQIITHEGDYAIHEFVEREKKKYEGIESVRNTVTDEGLATLIRELKDHLTYLLCPMGPEFDRRGESRFGLGFGGALLRSLAHVPKGPSTYFLHDWK
ncbi:hypothetical protein L1987_57034 [Smallanthus sonchifolius]|uniref:Uncharacterized protein n=1 Tax=Smallanthus sonchifolius TaxID=185202 RepID=A0ACB9DBK2_9ASTR|nr:hypothetical protein L1987_57034 [Smallanthus sonchifolius]